MDNKYYWVSSVATAIETVGVYANQGVHRTLMHFFRRIFGSIYSITLDSSLTHFVFGSVHRRINLILSRQYRSKLLGLDSLERFLTAIQIKTEKNLKKQGVVYNDWTFSSENRKTIRRIFQFVDDNTGFIKEIPITYKFFCLGKYIHLQELYRRDFEKVEVISIPENICFEEFAKFSRHATGIYGHYLGRPNVKKFLRSYMTGKTNEEVQISHSRIQKADLLYHSGGSKKYLPLFAIVKIDENCIAVVIRGTSSVFDAISDLKSNYNDIRVGSVKGKVHNGIHKSALKVAELVKNFLKSYLDIGSINKICITGHSLGAGCGGLLHLIMISDPFYSKFSIRSYLFAPPPVMSSDLNNLIKKDVFSCVNSNDIVPRLSIGTVKDLCDAISTIYTEGAKKINDFTLILPKLVNEKLEIPGTVLQIYKKTEGFTCRLREVHFETDSYYGSFVSNSFSEDIVFSGSMVTDHKATSYQKGLESLASIRT